MGSENKSIQSSIGELKATVDYLREDLVLLRQSQETMNQTLAVNTKQLELHIEGVRLAREQNELLKKDVDARFDQLSAAMSQQITPLQTHVNNVGFAGKILISCVGLPAAIYYVIKIIQLITGKG